MIVGVHLVVALGTSFIAGDASKGSCMGVAPRLLSSPLEDVTLIDTSSLLDLSSSLSDSIILVEKYS